jgi:hypothetical protein
MNNHPSWHDGGVDFNRKSWAGAARRLHHKLFTDFGPTLLTGGQGEVVLSAPADADIDIVDVDVDAVACR